MHTGKTKKRISLSTKLITVFGLLIAVATISEGIFAVRTARSTVTEKIEMHLTDKATDVAEIIDGRIDSLFQFLESIARMPLLQHETLTMQEKARALASEATFNVKLNDFGLCSADGIRYATDGTTISVSDREWFRTAREGKRYVFEPHLSRASKKLLPSLFTTMTGRLPACSVRFSRVHYSAMRSKIL